MTALAPSTAAAATRDVSQPALWLAIGALYAAAAVPLFFIYNLLPAAMRQAGQPPEIANLVFLAYFPFALRAVWAPLIDRLGRGLANRFRRIALTALALAILSTAALLASSPAGGPLRVILVASLLVICAASATIALDGYLLATLAPADRKRSASLQGAGFAFGGLAMGIGVMALDLLFLGGAAWHHLVLLLVLAMAGFGLAALRLPRSLAVAAPSEAGAWRAAGRLLARAVAWRRIGLTLLTHGGLGLVGGMLPVLQVDAGLSLSEIAALAAIGSNGVGLVSAALTGLALRRASPWQAASAVSLLATAIFGGLALLAPAQAGAGFAVAVSLLVIALGYGFFVVFRALSLEICDAAGGATQAAVLSSIDALIAMASAISAGWVLASLGPARLLSCAAVLCALGGLLALLAGRKAAAPATFTS